ncbi:MAG: tRNA preQ1(34) S-adenosylmethionine ribosyltransferase-isomerase QueA [Acidobacteriota bacterium]
MDVSLFDYYLPKELIVQHPLERRDESRMMVVDKKEKKSFSSFFKKFPEFLRGGDVLVINNTKVIPAKIYGYKNGDNKPLEMLLVREVDDGGWEILVKNSRRLKEGDLINFCYDGLKGLIIGEKNQKKIIRFSERGKKLEEILKEIGFAPLPPYIKKSPLESVNLRSEDLIRYQSIWAKKEGSIATPTASLHFTEGVIEEIRKKGVEILEITLKIGEGTFRPVRTDDVDQHVMEREEAYIDIETGAKIETAKREKRRIVAVGTTVTRALESAYKEGKINTGSFFADIFIRPPYEFKIADCLLTNFHLPKSTLLMLVSAFAGLELIRSAYEQAIREKYRFYSYGDCMFIL